MSNQTALIAIFALIAIGCGLDEKGKDSCDKPSDCLEGFVCAPDGTCIEGPGTYGEFLKSFVGTYCAKIESCCEGLPASFSSQDTCVTSLMNEIPSGDANAELQRTMITNATDCVREIEAMNCMETNDARLVFDLVLSSSAEVACLDLLPTTPVCNGALCNGACIDNVCYARVSAGQACCAQGQSGTVCTTQLCGEAEYCNLDGDNLCHSRLAVGQACERDGECSSFFCNGTTKNCDNASLDSVICPSIL